MLVPQKEPCDSGLETNECPSSIYQLWVFEQLQEPISSVDPAWIPRGKMLMKKMQGVGFSCGSKLKA